MSFNINQINGTIKSVNALREISGKIKNIAFTNFKEIRPIDVEIICNAIFDLCDMMENRVLMDLEKAKNDLN